MKVSRKSPWLPAGHDCPPPRDERAAANPVDHLQRLLERKLGSPGQHPLDWSECMDEPTAIDRLVRGVSITAGLVALGVGLAVVAIGISRLI